MRRRRESEWRNDLTEVEPSGNICEESRERQVRAVKGKKREGPFWEAMHFFRCYYAFILPRKHLTVDGHAIVVKTNGGIIFFGF